MGKLIDLTGQRFGRLTVIERAEDVSSRHGVHWLCRCDCGNEVIVNGSSLRRQATKSCGCSKGELIASKMRTHGQRWTRLYNIWIAMKQRCYNPKFWAFDRYGGRGITVCEEWREDFDRFRDWAMAHGYADALTIDRIDNNGPYAPENCRWVDRTGQARNRKTTRFVTLHGQTKPLTEWAEEYHISLSTIYGRLNRGWSVERALTEPVHRPKDK